MLWWSEEQPHHGQTHHEMFTHPPTTSVSTRADWTRRDSGTVSGQKYPMQTTEGASTTLGQPLAGQQAAATPAASAVT